jgi:hypothetical protein
MAQGLFVKKKGIPYSGCWMLLLDGNWRNEMETIV